MKMPQADSSSSDSILLTDDSFEFDQQQEAEEIVEEYSKYREMLEKSLYRLIDSQEQMGDIKTLKKTNQ